MWLRIVSIFVPLVVFSEAQALLGLDEGDECKRAADAPWTCTSLKKCSHVDVRILRPTICSFKGREPIICCPPKKMSKAEQKCLGYTPLCNKFNMFRSTDLEKARSALDWADFGDDALAIEIPNALEAVANNLNETSQGATVTSDVAPTTQAALQFSSTDGSKLEPVTETTPTMGKSSNTTDPPPAQGRQFVVGGHFSLPRIHRHLAAIGYGRANQISWNCGGSLLSELWVLSAAHCTSAPDLGVAKWARLGELDLASTTEDARPQDRRIVQRINHPQYRPPAAYHDIALYKLDSPVVFNQYVAPVCLQTMFDIGEQKATVVGWGSVEFAGSTSSKLMEVDVTLVDNAECRLRYGSEDQQAPNGIDNTSMVCAGEKEGGKDACTGDSGGPLAVNQVGTCLKKQVGITSFGRDCGLPNTPGIYTRVSTYVPWIEQIVWP